MKLNTHNGIYMTHIYYGDPSEEFSLRAIKAFCESGVDIVEFGIPFSDPTSDGPVFQRACDRALKKGMTPEKAIAGIKKLRKNGIKQPIVVTSYYNIVFHMGIEEFVKRIKQSGADALIVPNLPFEEADPLLKAGRANNITIIFLVAPTTPEKRLKKILKRAQGFVYVVAVTGVTGTRDSVQKETTSLIKRVRNYSNIPLLVGFGISKPEHARTIVAAGADGVITGSAIGRIYEKHLASPEDSLDEIRTFAKNIKEECKKGFETRNHNL